PQGLPAGPVEPLALPAFVPQRTAIRENHPILVMAVAGLMMLGLSSVIAVTGGFKTSETARPASSPAESKDRLAPGIVAQPSSGTSRSEGRKSSSGRGELSHRQVGSGSRSKQNETDRSNPSDETSSTRNSATKSPSSNEQETKSQDNVPTVQSVNVVMKIEK